MKNTGFYFQEALRIINLLKKDFLLKNGALCLERSNGVIFPHHIFPDLGDFLPFFLYFGERDFIDKQIDIYRNILENGILISEFPSFFIKGLAKSYEYTDLLFGLLDYHFFKKDEKSLKLLVESSNTAINIFRLDKKISSFYSPKLNLHFPIFDTRDSTFIEIFIELYKLTGNKKYLNISSNIYDNLIQTDFYKKIYLFSVLDTNRFLRIFFDLISDKFKYSQVCKNNTNSLFGLLSLWKETRDTKILDTIFSIVDNLKNKATIEKGGVINIYNPKAVAKEACLTASMSLLDFLCDFYFYYGRKKDLDYAENIAEYWLTKQGKTGLFPLYGKEKDSFFDSETDMCIALFKLYELTNNKKYYEMTNYCFNGIIKFHGANNYVLKIDIDNGGVVDNTQRTKFIALFLKLLILKIELASNKSIYKNNDLLNLIKDR